MKIALPSNYTVWPWFNATFMVVKCVGIRRSKWKIHENLVIPTRPPQNAPAWKPQSGQNNFTEGKRLRQYSKIIIIIIIFFLGGGTFLGAGAAPPPNLYCPGVSCTVILYQGHNCFENLFIATYVKILSKCALGGKTPLFVQNFDPGHLRSTKWSKSIWVFAAK